MLLKPTEQSLPIEVLVHMDSELIGPSVGISFSLIVKFLKKLWLCTLRR